MSFPKFVRVVNQSQVTPNECLDSAINNRITVLTYQYEFNGILRGFDSYSNMILEDVTEIGQSENGPVTTKLDQILLLANQVVAVLPNGLPEQ